ncbi:stage III sporulation AC/AD family protein [Candidatus Agathobaculum pullicola]|uniref:stage III sporulation AC/AD family protein n=1 Tax=Candidatus Agathobaculum pullicola TaxID=2838426 RepID=UPI003F917845
MNSLVAACGLVLLVLVLSMTLKKDAPAIAFLLTLTAGVLILLRAFALVGGTMQRFSSLLAQGGITQSLYLPVLKTVGVAVVVRIMSALCRDSGQSALATKLEIMGAILALSMCLPLLEQVLELVTDWTI